MFRSLITGGARPRRFATGSTLLLAGALLSSCSGSDGKNETTGSGSQAPGGSGLITIITPPPRGPVSAAAAGAAEATAQGLGYETSVRSHDDDPNKQSRLIDAAIAERAVAIILDNAGADASIGPVQKAVDAGIPVFLIAREINSDSATGQIVVDNARCARLGARSFVEAMGAEGEYVELAGTASDPDAGERSSGYQAVVSRQPEMERAARETVNGQREAFTRMRDLIRRNPGIDGVIAGDDAMALGAVSALRAAGLTDAVVVGFDGSPAAVRAIREGAMHATVLRPAVDIAELAVERAHEVITTGEAPRPARQSIDCELITTGNADEYGARGPD